MLCLSCESPVEPGNRFCPRCGSTLAARCASCGADLPGDARFCAACGTAITVATAISDEPADSSRGRERKITTLLFADLVGFTELNERQDPEVVQALVNRAFDRLSAEVRRYEGLIEKFAGDAMLAIFGVPAAHEDDPERAVRAALELQQVMGELRAELEKEGRPALSLRIGVETGEVLVDQTRVTVERDRMVTGDPVNSAARLQQAAAPGAVVVGPGTYAATRELIDYEELEPITLKGKALPVAAWRAVGVKTRRDGQRAVLGLEAPLVGRDEEFALVKETLRRTVAEGRPHLITILGSAGVGKSRLIWELEKYLDGLPEPYHWRKGRCLAYAQASYSALADAIVADASIRDDDPAVMAIEKLRGRLVDLSDAEPAHEVLAGVSALLGLASDSNLGREELFDACRAYLDLLARRAPLILVLEDIHWADEGLLDFIEFLTRWAEEPMLLLCPARHELLERRPAWSGGIPNAATIVLEPLASEENAQLIRGLLRGGISDELGRRIVDVAEGNPLFTEELVRLLVDRGVVRHSDGHWEQARPFDEIEIPGSIHALLAARLDTLPAEEKRLGQDAAVVGRVFWDQVVTHLANAAPAVTSRLLKSLRVKELIVPRQPSSLTDAAEFSFRHVLIRDVAYESLPKLERARKHREVARWAEARMGDRLDELVELLAAHYWSALRYHEEFATGEEPLLTELREKTLAYARRAAERASSLWQLESAARWMRVAVQQSRQMARPAEEHAALLLEYVQAGNAFEKISSMLAATDEAVRLLHGASEKEHRLLLARIQQWHAFFQYTTGKIDDARLTLTQGLAALEGESASRERASLLYRLGWTYWRGGPVEAAPQTLERAISEARIVGSARREAWATHDLGIALTHLGRPGEGLALIEQSFELARRTDDRPLIMRCYINLPTTIVEVGGDYLRAVAMYEDGLQRARRSVDRTSQYWITNGLASTLAVLGRFREALPLQREAVAAGEAIGYFRRGLPELAWALGLAGRLDEARAAWSEARLLESTPEPQMRSFWKMVEAGLSWHVDPAGSVEMLASALEPGDHVHAGYYDACRWVARMAARTNQTDAGRHGVAAIQRGADAMLGPLLPLQARWLRALLATPSAHGVTEIAEIARQLEEIGHGLLAADACADAALVARRAGLDAGDLERDALQRYEACGSAPLLSDLPERGSPSAPRQPGEVPGT